MQDWLPVRLAPRDGTPVILWIEDEEATHTYPVRREGATGASSGRATAPTSTLTGTLSAGGRCRPIAGPDQGLPRRTIGVAETFYEPRNLQRIVGMDKETQQRRLLNLVKTITTRALALPTIDREAFIEIEIRSFRQSSADTYQANPAAKAAALDLADKMRGWIFAMIKMLEVSGEKPGNS